jgi:salicylate hydroxylase
MEQLRLIGADGIRSTVRKSMFEAVSKDNGDDKADLEQYIDATFTGMFIYHSVVSAETLRKENPENHSLEEFTLVSSSLHGASFYASLCYISTPERAG